MKRTKANHSSSSRLPLILCTASSSSASNNGPVLSFSGDELLEEDPAVDLFQNAEKEVAAADAAEAEARDEEEDDEPEDDFNAAWDVLDLARAIYVRQQDDEEVRMKLADTYVALGDVSLETGWSLLSSTETFLTFVLQRSLTKRSKITKKGSNSRLLYYPLLHVN